MEPTWDDEALAQAVQEMWAARAIASDLRAGKHLIPLENLVIDYARRICKGTPITFLQGREARVPGFYRARKDWDVIALDGDRLVFAIEMKSQDAKKVGNNSNNRSEEAVGSATDLRLSYDKGLLGKKVDGFHPWLGYVLILEEAESTTREAPHQLTAAFPVDPTYGTNPSYAHRYRVLCQRLLETGIYDGACFLLSGTTPASPLRQPPPSTGIDFPTFMQSLTDHLTKYCANRPS
ncbi:PaeR7I family type II restriction endonuclease [Streptomyces sp. enrichment culture]|uniref:PaeR7I family type II restriction endonuclease n=1 Tax=Streptomyces sp. enrichment culture TaxID=1795815 RepID=UPI003F56F45B